MEKKVSRHNWKSDRDTMWPQYDLSHLKGGARGKYYRQATAGTNLVLIDREQVDSLLKCKRNFWIGGVGAFSYFRSHATSFVQDARFAATTWGSW